MGIAPVHQSYPPIRDAADARSLEAVPVTERIAVTNSFDAIRIAAEAYPDSVALKLLVPGEIDAEPRCVTYRELLARSYQTANLLHALGVGPGKVVSMLLPLGEAAYYTLVGGEAAGIVNPVNPLLEDWQIGEILKAAGATVLVAAGPAVSPEIWAKVEAVMDRLPALETVLVVGGGAGGPKVRDFAAVRDQPDDRLASGRVIAPGDIAAYFHTGGTTGTPKLARHTHYMQAVQIYATGAAFGLRPGDVMTAGLPLFHIGGSIVGTIVPLAHAATLAVLSPAGYRDPTVVRDLWLLIHRHRVSVFGAVPTVLGALLNVPVGNADISSIRLVLTGGASMPVEVGRTLERVIGRPILEGYGMTETTSYVTLPPRDGDAEPGPVGIPLPYCEVKTVRLDGTGGIECECAVDEIGTVVMRGPSITPGYVQERYNAGTLLAGGWLNSGDLGRFDAEGRLWLTGREKDLIIRGGHNIDPAVIEEILHQHPAVELAAAVGKPDAYAGELPIAYIQLKPGAAASPDELQGFARERIPERAANPVNVFMLDAMPLTAVGKIFKPALRWDALARVYAELLTPLAESARREVSVTVDAHDLHGSLAAIAVSGPREHALESRIDEVLAPYTTRYEVRWTGRVTGPGTPAGASP